MESLLKNLKKHVECPICLDKFTDPKTVACLHTFCCECLKKHALVSQRDGQFRCPECQTQIAIPEENRFDQLPTSFLHNSLLSLLTVQQSGNGSEISCGNCKKKGAEASYCFECEKLLCSDCLNAHELFKDTAFAGHKVTSIKQFQGEDYEALLKRKTLCTEKYHEKEVTRFYCRVCQSCICQICFSMEHKTHEIELLDKAADDERVKILAEVEFMNQKQEVCSELVREFEETAANLEANVAAAKSHVSRAADQMITTIHERKLEAIITLENTRVSRVQKLDVVKNQVQQLAKQIKQAAEFATELVQRSSSADIMRSRGNLEERFEELGKTQLPALPVSSFVKFVSTCDLDTLCFGLIKSSETDTNRSTIEGLEQNFRAGVEAEISICLKTISGEISNLHHGEDHVEVQVEPAHQLASLIINKEAVGNFQVNFVPKLPGVYKILAKINGENLAESPFNIEVKERQFERVGELELQNVTLRKPAGIAVSDKGLIAVTDYEKHCILIFETEGKFVRQFGCYGKNPGQLDFPADVTFLNDDEILVADNRNNRIQHFNVQSGSHVRCIGRKGKGDAEFNDPSSICLNREGNIIVTEFGNHRVQVLTKDGAPVLKFGDSGPEKLNHPTVCVHNENVFIVADSDNGCLKVFDSSGVFLRKIGREEGLTNPWGLCIDKHGNIMVVERCSGHVKQLTFEGHLTGKTISKLNCPLGVATLPDGQLLITDSGARKVVFLK